MQSALSSFSFFFVVVLCFYKVTLSLAFIKYFCFFVCFYSFCSFFFHSRCYVFATFFIYYSENRLALLTCYFYTSLLTRSEIELLCVCMWWLCFFVIFMAWHLQNRTKTASFHESSNGLVRYGDVSKWVFGNVINHTNQVKNVFTCNFTPKMSNKVMFLFKHNRWQR